MKTTLLLLFTSTLLLSNCSQPVNQDEIVQNLMNSIVLDQGNWMATLQKANAPDRISDEELRRIYFSNQSTSSTVYLDVSMFVQYFDIDRKYLQDYRDLLDARDHLTGPFYSCDSIPIETIQNLITIEKQIQQRLTEALDSTYK